MVEIHKARHLATQILHFANEYNVVLRSYKVATDHLADVEHKAGPNADICGIYGAVRMESGLDYYNKDPNNSMSSREKQRDSSL